MTRIEFYFNADSKLRVAGRLVTQALRERARVLIYVPEPEAAHGVADVLREFPTIRYAHAGAPEAAASEARVVIACDADAALHDEVLLNLGDGAPPRFSRFRRLIEIVARAEDDRRTARERFRFYRDRGYAIRHYDMTVGAA